MAKDYKMEVIFKELVSSTQTKLIKGLEIGQFAAPCMLIASRQEAGFGSRGSAWQSDEGNFFASFALSSQALPDDLPLSAISIYFAYLFATLLREKGSKLFVKWPNDLYIDGKKIGGVLSTKKGEIIVCGIGLNLEFAPHYAGVLDIKCEAKELGRAFAKYLEILPKWKEILSKFKVEFQKSKKFSVHVDLEPVSLENAVLNDDGSISIDGKKVFLAR